MQNGHKTKTYGSVTYRIELKGYFGKPRSQKVFGRAQYETTGIGQCDPCVQGSAPDLRAVENLQTLVR